MGALLFPGQGSQLVGMGSEFFKNFKLVKKIFNEADEKLNYSISKIILEGPADQLQLTKIATGYINGELFNFYNSKRGI